MSIIKVTITSSTYSGTINGTTYTKSNTPIQGEWVYSNGFLYQDGANYVLLVFNSDNTVSSATSSTPFASNPSVTIVSQANWSGILPREAIDSARRQINSGEEELYRVQGSAYNSYRSNYEDTMLAGVFVAMLGASVIFYVYR